MFRYIIVIGSAHDGPECEVLNGLRFRVRNSPDWRSAIDQPGIYAAYLHCKYSSGSAFSLAGNRGIVLGALYRSPGSDLKNSPAIIQSLSPQQSAEIIQSKGRSMTRDYWGYYVAALRYPEKSSCLVMRSPVSPLACFQAQLGAGTVFFSHLDDYAELYSTPLSINWDCIVAQMAGGDYLSDETAINEITSVECGESVECGPNGSSRSMIWDPRSLLKDRSLDGFAEAAETLRDATEHGVRALSASHDHVLITLSGGLDSSIVLSVLSRSPHRPRITAVNYHSRGTGDERRFARSMAGAVNCKLVERTRNQALDLHRFEECNRTVRPVLNFSAPDTEARNAELARELNASAIFDGELGDNVFGSHVGPGALVEGVRRLGVGRRYLSTALDYAMLNRQSLWLALSSAHREGCGVTSDPDFSSSMEMRRHYGEVVARNLLLASPEAEEHGKSLGNRFIHPWLRQSRLLAPGSYGLLFGLITVTSTSYHSPFSRPSDPPRVSPLVSQPLVEAALRIPAYLHCKHARDRAVARTAFADALPMPILQRGRGKGGPTLWAKDVVERNTAFLREFLLDGILVRRRLIDRNKLETVLSPRIAKSTVIVGDIFAKLYIEAWLRKWPQ